MCRMPKRVTPPQPAPEDSPGFTDLAAGWGGRLKLARMVISPSARALAVACNVSPQRWSHWETDKHPPEFRAMLLLKHWHGVSLDWIYAGDADGLSGHLIRKMLGVADQPDIANAKQMLRARMLAGATGEPRRQMHEDASGM